MKAVFAVVMLCVGAFASPVLAQVDVQTSTAKCLSPYPNPTSPSAGVPTSTFSASWASADTMTMQLWREPCAADPTRTFTYLRVTPTKGKPYVCSSSFHVIQNGQQKNVKVSEVPAGYSWCDDVLVPITFILGSGSSGLPIDFNIAFTLVYSGVYSDFQGALPAYVVVPPGPPVYTPATGLWWNEAESGSGYALDVKRNVLVMTTYSYTPEGAAVWYISSGPIVNNVFKGTLDKYGKGQCISCKPYPGRPESLGNDGQVTITFLSNTSAVMDLPGGRTIVITPQPF